MSPPRVAQCGTYLTPARRFWRRRRQLRQLRHLAFGGRLLAQVKREALRCHEYRNTVINHARLVHRQRRGPAVQRRGRHAHPYVGAGCAVMLSVLPPHACRVTHFSPSWTLAGRTSFALPSPEPAAAVTLVLAAAALFRFAAAGRPPRPLWGWGHAASLIPGALVLRAALRAAPWRVAERLAARLLRACSRCRACSRSRRRGMRSRQTACQRRCRRPPPPRL